MSRGSVFDQLEPGGLRDELAPELRAREQAAEAQRAAEEGALAAREYSSRLQFTGDGGEYFRIWIVNLLLTLATAGVYSAWAKVRKTRYFWQNTRLDGCVFDDHGAPAAILRGRVLALVLLGLYTLGTGFSVSATVAVVLLPILAGPWLFLRAQQFKLRNTSYRGLRFDFDVRPRRAYAALLPLPVIWFSGTLVGAFVSNDGGVAIFTALASLLLFPWMHHRLKRLQHSHARFGDLPARFVPATGRFYEVYAKSIVLMIVASLVTAAIGFAAAALANLLQRWFALDADAGVYGVLGGVVGVAAFYLALWPYYAASLPQVVWENTTLGPVRFRTHMRAAELARLVLRCVALTVLTLGLYWPYAAVRLARYRIESMEVRTTHPLSEVAQAVQGGAVDAAGDGAADLFGLDIGL
ncbi:MAG: YjgN family protein [Betaproteobacteria bacterium]|jgi:uncharacterized membrane protein YjgN (DUF898 family)